MAETTYFFVNKDPSSNSLTQGPRHQRSAIQRHVQRGLARKEPLHIQDSKRLTKLTQTYVDDRALYSPSVRALSCRLDAFRSASICIDRTVRVLLDYYVYYYHPMIWNYEPFASPPLPHGIQDAITKSVRTALQDSLAMNCLLSSAASRMINVDGFPFPGDPYREHLFMQEALSLMRQRIEENKGENTGTIDNLVECMTFLCSAEAHRGNYDAARLHLIVALKSLQSRGVAASQEHQHLLVSLIEADLVISCINQQPCLLPYELYDPGPAATLDLKSPELVSFDQCLFMSKLLSKPNGVVPQPLKNLIAEVVDVYGTKRALKISTMTAERAFQATHWVQKRNMAIQNRLLGIDTEDLTIQALRTALIMWTLLTMNLTGRLQTVKRLAIKLQSILNGIPRAEEENDEQELEDIRLWILLVGYCCVQEGSETEHWLAEQIRWMLLQHLKSSFQWTRENLAQVLSRFQRNFFYDDAVQGSRTQLLAAWLETVSIED